MTDILVVGHAPILAVNRAAYSALARKGWAVEIAVPTHLTFPGPNTEPRREGDPPIHFLAPVGGNTRYWRFEGLSELVKRLRPGIILLENEPDSRMAWTLGALAAALGAKLVCQSNENDLPPVVDALLYRNWKPALRSLRSRVWSLFANRRIAHVFAISEHGLTTMENLGFAGRASLMPLGFDPATFVPHDANTRAATRARLGLRLPTIAYFGRLMHIKGVHVLVEALARLKDLQWQFLLDEVNEKQDLYVARLNGAIHAAGLENRCVRFHVGHAGMPTVMNAADIVVVPSIWKEQYGRVAPEAMACGRAVIVSEVGALPGLVSSVGLKVPPGDVAALTEAIRSLLLDPARSAAMGAAAAAHAHSHLSLLCQVNVMDRVFRALLSRKA